MWASDPVIYIQGAFQTLQLQIWKAPWSFRCLSDHFTVVANAMQNESGRGEKKSWFDADLKN